MNEYMLESTFHLNLRWFIC